MKKIKSASIEGYVIASHGAIPRHHYRKDKYHAPNNSEIQLCEEWLAKFTKQQAQINKSHSSYGLKHQVEKWAGKYISNGAFIYAAFSLDYRINIIKDGPNASFGIKLFTPKEKWKHVRPTSFSRWLFAKRKDDTVVGDLARDAIIDDKWPRRASEFIEFWEYLKNLSVHSHVIRSLCVAWEAYSGEKPPEPTDKIICNCESFYEDEEDIVCYGDDYKNAPNGSTFIYVLFEEIGQHKTRRVRYVGQSVCPSQRLKQHINMPGNIEKVAWVGGLINDGTFPKMGIIDCVPIEDSIRLEKTYIHSFIYLEKRFEQNRTNVLLNKSLV